MSSFELNGIRKIGFDMYKRDIRELKSRWKGFVKTIPPCPANLKGRGIVMCAGGLRYFTCAWVNIMTLRKLGCTLPVEVWYTGNELSEEIKAALEPLNVRCRNLLEYVKLHTEGYVMKPFCILYSAFKEILFLDADNVCIHNPEQLFELDEFRQQGAVFWPDYWQTAPDNPIWTITGVPYSDAKEQESGQILIDKERCWTALHLCLYFNQNSRLYYKLLLGDKDTFRFAWLALNAPFHMIQTEPASCGYCDDNGQFMGISMVQHDTNGAFCFLHRNLLKWDITKPGEKAWCVIKRFYSNAQTREYHLGYSEMNGHYYMDLKGDVEEISFTGLLYNYEDVCARYLQELRAMPFYHRFITYSHFAKYRYPRELPFTLGGTAPVPASLP